MESLLKQLKNLNNRILDHRDFQYSKLLSSELERIKRIAI